MNDGKIYIDEGFNNVSFLGGKMGVFSVGLDKSNLDDVNFDEMILTQRYKQRKSCKSHMS